MLKKETWSAQASLVLSRVVLAVFFTALVLCDLFGWPLVHWFCERIAPVNRGLGGGLLLLGWGYLCSIPAYLVLWDLHRLLANITAEHVFFTENVRRLRRISWCCFAAAISSLVCAFFWPSLLLVTAAAGFMGLIVRVVKNVFARAVAMKDELDLTI